MPTVGTTPTDHERQETQRTARRSHGDQDPRRRPFVLHRGGPMSTRRQFIGAVAAGLAGLAAPARGQAQGAATSGLDGWPTRSVRVISPTGTGGPGQNFRLYAEQLKDAFGQSFVLENMPGGSGAIGSMTVARAAPDGHTLLLASNSHIVLAPLVLTNSPVNVKRDYAAIALTFTFPFLLVVNPTLPVRTLKDLVAYAKARPNE